MTQHLLAPSILALFVALQACHSPSSVDSARGPSTGLVRVGVVELPDGGPGIGFDDLRFDTTLNAILAPGGRSGYLDLIGPESLDVTAVSGFSEQSSYSGGHDDGVTSADAGPDAIFAVDRTSQKLSVVDVQTHEILRSTKLAAHPDYVRYVASTNEAWVTEPDADQLEVFSLGDDGRHPSPSAVIPVPGGPESLVDDNTRAYTHLWAGKTVAIDLATHAQTARWSNGCRGSRGMALDAEHALLIAACSEGKVTVVEVDSGETVSSLDVGAGVDVIDFDPESRHVYIPSGSTGKMTVAFMSADGHLQELGQITTERGAHCVVADRKGHAFVCDPSHGRLIMVRDEASPRREL